MTQEEKAKAYDEALEKAKKTLESSSANEIAKTVVCYFFPELCESDDERIRKGLIEALKTSKTVGELKFILPEPTREECIAYLEKQKEQKPVNHSLTTWHRDVVYCAMCNKNLNEGLRCNLEMVYKTIKELVDRTPVIEEQKPAEWSEEDEEMLEEIINHIDTTSVQRIPARPGSAIGKSWIKFLKSIRPQPKQEWSEEDEDMLNCCISSIEEAKENRYAYKETDGDTSYDHEIDWLNSLRPSWKPSEEQEEPEYYQHFDPDC